MNSPAWLWVAAWVAAFVFIHGAVLWRRAVVLERRRWRPARTVGRRSFQQYSHVKVRQ